MLTIEQITDLHARLGSAKTFPEYVLALKGLVRRTVRFLLGRRPFEVFRAGRPQRNFSTCARGASRR